MDLQKKILPAAWVMLSILVLSIMGLVLVFAEGSEAGESRSGISTADASTSGAFPNGTFPSSLTDVDGRRIDVATLARESQLIVVTMKAAGCPVCFRQLERLKSLLPELRPCNVSFIVLGPGRAADFHPVRESSGFPFPFVADEGLRVANSLGLDRPGNEIMPCLFRVNSDLSIGWRQLGRNGVYFGDGELRDYIDCDGAI